MNKVATLLGAFVLGPFILAGCVTHTHAVKLTESEGRVGYESTRIAGSQSKIMQSALQRFKQKPVCNSVKTSLSDSRRALSMEECTFGLQPGEFDYAGKSVENLKYRFIDGRLLQMEFEFARSVDGTAVGAAIKSSLNTDLVLAMGSDESRARSWETSNDVVELVNDSTTSLKITDARLAKTVVALSTSAE